MKTVLHILSCIIVLSSACGVYAADKGVGRIVSLKPPVTIERSGEDFTANLGDEVKLRDIIKTGIDARAKILFGKSVILIVTDNTTVEIEEHLYDTATKTTNSVFDLQNGMVRSMLEKFHDTNLDIRSRNAVAGVRGTDFIMSYAPDKEQTHVYVFDGTVEVKNRLGPAPSTVMLPADHWTDVLGSRAPEPPRILSREISDSLIQKTSIADQVRKDSLRHFQRDRDARRSALKSAGASRAGSAPPAAANIMNPQVEIVGKEFILPASVGGSISERAPAIAGGVTTSPGTAGRNPPPGGGSTGSIGRPGGSGAVVGRPGSGTSGGGLPGLVGR